MVFKKKFLILFPVVFVLFTSLLPQASARGEKYVRTLYADGTLELDDGQKISLAGIRVSREGMRLLRPLLAGREVKIQIDSNLQALLPETAPKPAYVFATTLELDFPFFEQEPIPEERQGHINEFLIATGAAWVIETDAEYDYKDEFLRWQAQAKKTGEGIWSYESTLLAQTKESS